MKERDTRSRSRRASRVYMRAHRSGEKTRLRFCVPVEERRCLMKWIQLGWVDVRLLGFTL